jgi:hypothetical protein
VPSGPFTVIFVPSWLTSTPSGSGIGIRPIRDIAFAPYQT